MFGFAWPWMILLLALPIIFRVLAPPTRITKAEGFPEIFFPYIDRLKTLFPKQQQLQTSGYAYRAILASLWICLTVALMRPELVDQLTRQRHSGYDLLVAVDLSASMKALDYTNNGSQASRLDVVKSVAGNFVGQRQGDRVGLILFGSSAYLHVPLTFDTLSVRNMLDNAAAGEAGDMTAIGDAIGLAVRTLRYRPEKSRIVILLTDGGDNASTIPPIAAARLARQYGIRIYTIGVGSQGVVPIPDDMGQIEMEQFDLDEGLLQKIASITGASYFRAADTSALQNIYAQINKIEKTQAEPRTYVTRKSLYVYPLGCALALLLTFALLPIASQARRGI
jgi:Ca-activated chloride channel family protein